MKKYRIISQIVGKDGTITFIPQQRVYWLMWKNMTITRGANSLPITFIKLCDAYEFITNYIIQDTATKSYGTKIHQYP